MKHFTVGLCLMALAATAFAADVPRRSEKDTRVRYVTYSPDDVVVVNVRRGVVTRLILEAGEQITNAGTGLTAQCDKDDAEWCIRADRGSSQIWVRPKDKATQVNLELATNKRDYSIHFTALADDKRADDMYRIVFQYPIAPVAAPAVLFGSASSGRGTPTASTLKADVEARLAARPVPRNTNYTMEAVGGGDAIKPTVAFDDGRFTYFRFAASSELPAPFFIGSDNVESRVNFHMDDNLMVIHRVGGRFVLRLGEAVVGLWNEAFDPVGVETPTGTTAPDVNRDVK